MVARVATVAFHGIDVIPVDVQVQLASGLPAFTMVGLPDKIVNESRERVRAALTALGMGLPAKRITVLRKIYRNKIMLSSIYRGRC